MSKNNKPTSKKKGVEPVASKHMTPSAIRYRIEYFESQIKKKLGEREEVKAEIKRQNDGYKAAVKNNAPTDEITLTIDTLQNRYTVISTRIYALRLGMKRWIRVKAEREMELDVAHMTDDKVGAES